MRSLIEFLGDLRSKGVTLSLEGESLKCSAAPGILNPILKAELLQHKPAILAFLRSSQKSIRTNESVLSRVDRSGPLPLSYAQQRLWFLNQLDPDSTVYNIGAALELTGPLNIPALERSFRLIIRRHESLRTCFLQVDGTPHTVIREEAAWSLNVIDARHLSGSDLHKYASSLIREHIDITRAPLFRANLLTLGSESHILVLTLHHIISDGWSIGVLGQELSEIYSATISEVEPTLVTLSLQYVDFAVWQRKWLESGELDRQLTYWRKQLAGAPPVVVFPADHRRSSTELFRGTRSKLVVERELTAALETMSQRHGVTLFMVLLAAFQVLLGRYTGQDDIVVGSPTANRTRTEFHQMMGFFVNNLVLRTDLKGNPSFIELLKRVREVTLRAYEHQDVPFDELVQALRPERSLDHSPLFQTMYIFQNFPVEQLSLEGARVAPLELNVDTARFDLTVEAFPREGELHMFFDYNTDLYDAATIGRIQKHYVAILSSVVENEGQRIADIPLLLPSEREKLLFEWNETKVDVLAELCFHNHFEKHALATPDRVAVMAADTVLTYGELDEKANRIANALRARGAGPEKLVAIFQERGSDLVAAILGVAKSGAAYVPLDPAYPKGRIENILEDAQPVAIITSSSLAGLLPESTGKVLCLDEIELEYLPQMAVIGNVAAASQAKLAYVIFTSGSTGRPKGVEITHRSLLNFFEAMQVEPGISASDVLLAVTTVSFDIAGLELLLPLFTGSTLCISLQPSSPSALLHDLERYRPTVMQATPATWKLLIAAGWQGDTRIKILCGGEAMEPALARSLLVRSKALWNMYGPTETTIWSAAFHVEEARHDAIPIGRPIQNTTFYVLDVEGQPVPQGVAGELWIGGEGLARGYLNRPDLTAERFRPCLFVDDPNARMYRTGDLVRYRSDGTLDFYGRLDHQVKLRGFRIELGEIENALRIHSGIADAVTLVRENEGDKSLVAYLTSDGSESPSPSDLRNHLRESLPEYMVPAAFVFLREFPRLPNGKLDRSSLPAPALSGEASKGAFQAPATGLQQTVAQVFRNILSVDRVGLDDNWFDMGAHSLQMVKAHAELNRRLEAPIPLISFFQYPNIRSLTAYIEQSNDLSGFAAKAGKS